MIVGERKPLPEIWEMVKSYKKVFVFGCNTCVAVCFSGGEKEAQILASQLRMKAKMEGVEMQVTEGAIERQCEHEFFDNAKDQIEGADCILSIACGAGIQFTGEDFPHKIVMPGLNTTGIDVVEMKGVFSERCQSCGDCVLHMTGGICPIARCSKSILNGPCGGSHDGKCEIKKDTPCAWALIYDRLKAQGRLNLMEAVIPAKDWRSSRDGGPRVIAREDLKE